MVDQLRKERQMLHGTVGDLMLQHNMYLQEVKMTATFIIKIGSAFSFFKFSSSLVDQVKLIQ